MAESKTIQILSISKVLPVDSPSPFSLPLTFLDRLWLQIKSTSRLFFYRLYDQEADFYQTILLKLKHSLSLALKHYLPLAGNLTWPQDSSTPVVQYVTGDGVSLTTAEMEAGFDYLSGDSFRESAELRSLLPNFPSSITLIPAMAIQVTLFPNQGFSIGYVAHHAIMDGKSTSTFLHSWAYFCRNGDVSILPPELTPSFDRSSIEQLVELEKVYGKGFGPIDTGSKSLTTFDLTPPPTVLATYKLTRANIEVLKNKASNTQVSTFTVTSAYVLICLIKAKKVTVDLTCLAISADGRLRLDPPLPPTYFGNCLAGSINGHDTKDFLAEDGFVTAVNVICETLTNLNKGVMDVVDKTKSFVSSLAGKSYMVFGIGGSPRFKFYEVNFGWGKPIKVDMNSIDRGRAFSLLDDRDDNGGIEIGIVLEKHETKAFSCIFANELETR